MCIFESKILTDKFNFVIFIEKKIIDHENRAKNRLFLAFHVVKIFFNFLS